MSHPKQKNTRLRKKEPVFSEMYKFQKDGAPFLCIASEEFWSIVRWNCVFFVWMRDQIFEN